MYLFCNAKNHFLCETEKNVIDKWIHGVVLISIKYFFTKL